jgi:phosphoribosylamine---glycine ligase
VADVISIDPSDHKAVCDFAVEEGITLVVIGPEQPLEKGLADALRASDIDVFGPSAAAARLESSKGFSKDLMQRHGIPTAPFARFTAEQRDHALTYVNEHPLPVVIKYDGLAAGKGVVVADTTPQAVETVDAMLDGAFGENGIVIEGFLQGQEASVFAVCDGDLYVVLTPAQDHKRVGDGDVGKNTGGMGTYAPAPVVTDDVMQKVRERIIEPTLAGMKAEGTPFVGCLFCGLMIDNGEPSVVEFNARFGDPETQVVLSLLDVDVAALFASAARGTLAPYQWQTMIDERHERHAVCVVLASEGYPDSYRKGLPIRGIAAAEALPGVRVYHAGTKMVDGELVTNGGRVLGVTAVAGTLREARDRAYEACALIDFEGKTMRMDIASRALEKA